MAMIKVKATKLGYYNHARHREGAVFFMDEKAMKKDEKGKPILPSWVEYADKPAAKGRKAIVEEPEEIVESDEVI